jgi:small conductance mechanosensitive channel
MLPDFSDLPPSVVFGVQLLLIVVAALATFLAIRAAVGVGIAHVLERGSADEDEGATPDADVERRVRTLGGLAVRIGGALIAVIAGLMLLQLFGVDIGPAVAGLGVAGIAVGFGAQTLVRDWLAGIFVVVENQYNEGDVVRIAGVEGVVEDFSLRRTTLRDLDGTVHSVPNGQIVVASNLTRLWARVNLDVSVAYDTDIDRATELINRIGQELHADPEWGPRLLEAPSVVRVSALADSAVTLKVLGQVQAAQQWAVAGELRKRVLAGFAREGIEIPFPHRVIVNRAAPAGTARDHASVVDGGDGTDEAVGGDD